MLQQKRLHLRLQQKITLIYRDRSTLNIRIQRKPLAMRRANGRVQIVVRKRPGICHGKLPASLLKLLRPLSLGQPFILAPPMSAIEQPVQIHLHKPLPGHHRWWIPENQQHRTGKLPLALDQLGNQPVQNLNRRGLVSMNTR